MSRILQILTVCVACSLAACGDNGDKVQIVVFQASPDTIEAGQSTKLVFAVEPSDAKVTISSGVGDVTGKTEASVSPTDTTSYQLTATSGSAVANQTVKVTVGATSAGAVKVEPATTTPAAGDQVAVTLTVLGNSGKPAPGFRGTLHLTSTDPQAALPADVTFAAGDAGVKQVMVMLKTAGVSTLTATETTGKSGVSGSASLNVRPAPAHSYQLSALPANATAGDALVLTITVLDVFGNVATAYGGQVKLISTDATDMLPPVGNFTAGVRTVSVAFTKTGNHIAQAQDVASVIPSANTTTVAVGPAAAAQVALTASDAATTAGTVEPLTAKLFDRFGNVATNYTGTLHFTSTDANAVLPVDFTFTAADAGTHDFNVTLKTAGSTTVTARDPAAAALTSSAAFSVSPAAASAFALTALPASATAGDPLVLTIKVQDAFGNLATNFAGQAQVTSGDPSDVLPPVGGFTAGVRTVSLAFTKAGSHTATVTDPASAVPPATTNGVSIVAAKPDRVAVTTVHPTTIAGSAEPLTVTVFDRFANVATNYTGTVHFAATDPQATLPADFVFGATDAGTHSFSVTLKTAGAATVTVADTALAAVGGAASWTVSPAAASAFQLAALPASATAGDALVLTIKVQDAFGNLATSFAGQAQVTSGDPSDVLPPVGGFTGGARTVSVTFTKAGSHTATVSDPANVIAPATTSSVSIVAGKPDRVVVTTVNPTTTAGALEPLTARVVDVFGNTCRTYLGTVHFAATDPNAVLPADFTFSPLDAGTHTFSVTLKTAGPATVTVADTALPAVSGAAAFSVSPATASTFALTALPASATAGQALVLTIKVQDAFGNLATDFAGQAQVTSGDATDVLPPVGGFTAGVRTVSVEFTKAGPHTATVSDPASAVAPATTSSVSVTAASPFRVGVTTANTATTAGATETVTTKIVDFFDNTCLSFTGTLHFASTDPQAVLPADFTFGAGDAGAHDFDVTLKTSGTTTLSISDTVASGLSGTATWRVGAAAAATCVASQAPTTATAGTVVGLTVAAKDTFGNVANGYAGTIQLTASDARANLPANVTYVPATDAGSHAFSVALLTTGSQTVTATDTANPAISCNVGISITPAAPKLVLTLPTDANAGFPVNVGVSVKDLFDNAIPTYAGTVTFTSTDNGAGAQTPGPITFTGSENGSTTTTATFVTIGPQTLSASDTGTPRALGTSAAAVHGLVYTAPTTGKVRLVANPVSNTQIVQLDLVASERLEVSTFFGGPGPFSAGMNLPLDTTRIGAGNPLFTRGPALPVGTGVAASVGALGTDHVLYTGVSRKRATGTPVATQDTDVAAGQVFYSVRLKLQQTGTVGPVFDGAQPMATFRAAVRDQFGDDFVGQSDFGIGKLEIR